MWSDSTELGMECGDKGRSLPVSGMGVKPENVGGHMGEGWFLFPLEQLRLSRMPSAPLVLTTPRSMLGRTQVPVWWPG